MTSPILTGAWLCTVCLNFPLFPPLPRREIEHGPNHKYKAVGVGDVPG